jgi:Fic family protein
MKTLLDTYSKYQQLPISEIMDYNRYNELLMIHSSSVMEGSTLTLDETEILIQEGIAPKGKPLSHSLMIKDHFDALQFVIEKSKITNIKVTSDFLKEIGARVMYGTGG